jgi:hypothetical protein
VKDLSHDPSVFSQALISGLLSEHKHLTFKLAAKIICKTIKLQRNPIQHRDIKIIKCSRQYKELICEHERKAMELVPVVNGRIINIGTS